MPRYFFIWCDFNRFLLRFPFPNFLYPFPWLCLLLLFSDLYNFLFRWVFWNLFVWAVWIFHQPQLMVFYWRLSDSKTLLISRTLYCTPAHLNHTVFWMVSIHPMISYYSSFLSKTLGTVPSALFTISSSVTLMFHRLFLLLVSLFVFFDFDSVVGLDRTIYMTASFLILVILTRFGTIGGGTNSFISKPAACRH